MKQVLRSAIPMVAIVGMLGCAQRGQEPGPTPPLDRQQMIAAAKELDQRFVAAYNAGDVDAVMACYWHSPNLVSFPPDAMELRGWDALKNDYARGFASMPGATLELTDRNYEVLGDAVVSWGTWRLTVPAPGGSPAATDGRYTDVKASHDGTWLYMLDHASVPMTAREPGSSM